MTTSSHTQRARELLADAYDSSGLHLRAADLRYGTTMFSGDEKAALRAIESALRLAVPEGMVLVPEWKLRRAAQVIEDDGDEHGVGADLRAMLPAAPTITAAEGE